MSATTLLTKQHFFQPLIPGFEDGLLIPAAFFKHLKEQKREIAMLRTQRKGKLWPVKINGRQLGDGWKQFVQDHDLQIGDFLLFRHEGDLVFYVLVFGRTTCEREYPPFTATEEEPVKIQEQNIPNDSSSDHPFAATEEKPIEIEEQNLPKDSSSGRSAFTAMEEEPIKIPEQNLPNDSSSDHLPFTSTEDEPIEIAEQNLQKCSISGKKFGRKTKVKTRLQAHMHPKCVIKLSPVSIRRNLLIVPLKFVRESGLYRRTCSITLKDEGEDSWRANLLYSKLSGISHIGAGWGVFHSVHKLKAGDLLMIELIKNEETPVFKMHKIQHHTEFTREPTYQKNEQAGSCSVIKKSYFEVKVTAFKSHLHIPMKFSRLHLQNHRYSEVILRDEEGRSWPAKLGHQSWNEGVHIADGWKEFSVANKLKPGDSFLFLFIENGKRPAFNMCGFKTFTGKNKEDALPHFYVNMQSYKRDLQMRIPLKFAREHGLADRRHSAVMITNEIGKSWLVSATLQKKNEVFLQSGWIQFVKENGIEVEDVVLLELVKGGIEPHIKCYTLKQKMGRNQKGKWEDCEDVGPII